ncbi:MAG: HIT family protein [Caldilineaceae bacterium]
MSDKLPLMLLDGCLSCDILAGKVAPPGGIVYENACWIVVLRARPLRFPCYPFIVLKRHCEHVQALRDDEVATLGSTMRLTAQVLATTIQPAKVHFGLYAEGVKHIHVHVFPRMPFMPPGNIPNIWIDQWCEVLGRVGLKKYYDDETVAKAAAQLRAAYQQMALASAR